MSAVMRRVRSVPKAACTLDELVSARDLALLVDDAAGGAATELHAGGAFEDLDLVIVEAVAVVAAEVADAVKEDVVAGGEAADGEVVPLGPGFAGGDGDAGTLRTRVLQGAVLLGLEDKGWDDGDGLRGVEEGLGEAGHRDGVGDGGADVDGLDVVETDGGGVAFDPEGEAGAVEELAEGGVGGEDADEALGLEAGELVGGQVELEGEARLVAEEEQSGVELAGGDLEAAGLVGGGDRRFGRVEHELLGFRVAAIEGCICCHGGHSDELGALAGTSCTYTLSFLHVLILCCVALKYDLIGLESI